MTRTRCLGDLVPLTVAVVARTALLTWLLIVAWAVTAAALGAETTTVVSDSMAPAIRSGDVVAVVPRAADDLSPGNVLLVDDPDHAGRLRLHRLTEVRDDGLRLRGDANRDADGSLVDPGSVHGAGVLRFPTAGLPALWVRNGDVGALVCAASIVFALVLLTRADAAIRSGRPCRKCWTPRSATIEAPQQDLAARGTTLLAVLLGLAVVASTFSSASFVEHTDSAASFGTNATYPCFRAELDDPVLAWDFDEPHGTTVTDHAASAVASMYGAVSREDRSCAENPFVRFALSDDSPRIVSTTTGGAPRTFSTEAWFRTTSARGAVLSFGSDSSPASSFKDRITYIDRNGLLTFGVLSRDHQVRHTLSSSAPVADGQWHHFVATGTPGRIELWLDGALQATSTSTDAGYDYAGSWRIGRQSVADWPDASSAYFVGDVDTVRVYDRVLDTRTIAEHAAQGR